MLAALAYTQNYSSVNEFVRESFYSFVSFSLSLSLFLSRSSSHAENKWLGLTGVHHDKVVARTHSRKFTQSAKLQVKLLVY